MTDRSYSFIGLAMKAGKVVFGEVSCEMNIKKGRALMVIVTCDASENTRKKFEDACRYRKIPLLRFGEKEALGRILGKDAISVIAITDTGFAQKLKELINARHSNKKKHGGGLIE